MEGSNLVIHPTGGGANIYWYDNKQVELCSVVRLLEKDAEGNWVKYEEIGKTLVHFPFFTNLKRRDAFDEDTLYFALYRKELSKTLTTTLRPRKAKKLEVGQLGVIRYTSFHDREFNELIAKSNYDQFESDAKKREVLSEICSKFEEKLIRELVEEREKKQPKGKKPRQRV